MIVPSFIVSVLDVMDDPAWEAALEEDFSTPDVADAVEGRAPAAAAAAVLNIKPRRVVLTGEAAGLRVIC